MLTRWVLTNRKTVDIFNTIFLPLPPWQIKFSRLKMKVLIFISSILILTLLKISYTLIQVLRRSAHWTHWAHLDKMTNCHISPVYTGLCLFMCLLKELGSEQAKSHWLHLFNFSPLCILKCLLKELGSEHAKSHWLHWLYFSPLCVFKCILKALAWADAKSHW